MRISRILAKAALIVLVVFAGNAALTFALTPYGSKSEIMWTDYYQEEHLDTVIVGTSLANRAFNPAIIDEAWNCSSYNMSTPVQSLDESLNAIKTAYREHGISRVILGTELATFQDESVTGPAQPFLFEKFRHEDAAGILSDLGDVLANPDYWDATSSLNFLSPWIYNHVAATPSTVVENIRMKRDGTTLYEAAALNEPGWTYFGKGHGNYYIDYAGERATIELYTSLHERSEFTDRNMKTGDAICTFCREHNIELIVVNVPEPQAVVLDYGDLFFQQSEQLRTFFSEERGVAYYDFCFAKPELFPSSDHCFPDTQHVNVHGGTLFCNAFVDLINRTEAGQDTSDEFFHSMDEFRASVTTITAIATDITVKDAVATINAVCLTGSTIEPEYCFFVKNAQTEQWEQTRPYSTESCYTFTGAKGSIAEIMVQARRAGSNENYERYCTTSVFL